MKKMKCIYCFQLIILYTETTKALNGLYACETCLFVLFRIRRRNW
jgi:hypothetical protein